VGALSGCFFDQVSLRQQRINTGASVVRVIIPKHPDLSIRRLVAGQCQSCGKQFFYRRTGRPKLFCDQKCRQSDFRRSGHTDSKISQIDTSVLKNEVNSGTFGCDSGDRPLRIVAGQLGQSALHFASLDATGVIEANNRLNSKAAPAVDAETMRSVFETEIIAGRNWEKVISPDGVTCYRARLSDAPPPLPPEQPRLNDLLSQIPDDLSIPTFLKRGTL
jgi:hypothetical protein